MKILTRNIWLLSLVSLFNDVASELLYPVMPIYLKSIGFSIILIGVLEGLAEATAGLSKGYFGSLSDQRGKRLPFIQLGYAFSSVAKPMIAVFSNVLWIFSARTLDRVGKGVRTAARDALLSDEAGKEHKATVFGFHRSMDTIGAVLGPLIALIYLSWNPGNYKSLFYWTLLPGIIAVCCTFLVKEKTKTIEEKKNRPRFFNFLKYWKQAPFEYKKIVVAFLVFALFNSADVFLLLKAKEAGCSDALVISIYIFYNLVYASFAYPVGILADKIGMKKIFCIGLLLFTAVYSGMAFAHQNWQFFALFFLYGLYAASTDGIAKAWISNLVEKENTATAIGTYTAFQSLTALLASTLAGFIWFWLGASAVFLFSGLMAFAVSMYLFKVIK